MNQTEQFLSVKTEYGSRPESKLIISEPFTNENWDFTSKVGLSSWIFWKSSSKPTFACLLEICEM